MGKNVYLRIAGGFFGSILAAMVLIFLPGGLGFEKGWLLMGLIFVPMLMITAMLISSDAEKLANCFQIGDKRPIGKKALAICGGAFVVLFAVSGLSFRFGWMQLGSGGTITGAILFVLGYGLFIESIRERDWVIRKDCAVDDLDIVDIGVHGFIRQPVYASMMLMFMGIPLLLGSLLGFFVSLVCVALIVIRIIKWEWQLELELPGYKDYEEIVKKKLIPFVW